MTKEILAMDRFAIQGGKSVREYDKNGFLHVDLSPMTRVQVAPYRGSEIPGWETLGLDANKVYRGYRSEEELSRPDTIKSMNGIPIQLDHNPDYADAPAKQTRVGSTGDKAHFDAPFLFNSLHVMDKAAIDRINDGSMRELSLAYRYRPDFTKGKTPQGEDYDFVMRDINANHLALVEQGRCGDQVLVYDSKMEQTMFEDDKSVPPPTANDEGASVDQLIQQMIDAGMSPEKAQSMRPQLEALANGTPEAEGGDNLPVEDEVDEDLDDGLEVDDEEGMLDDEFDDSDDTPPLEEPAEMPEEEPSEDEPVESPEPVAEEPMGEEDDLTAEDEEDEDFDDEEKADEEPKSDEDVEVEEMDEEDEEDFDEGDEPVEAPVDAPAPQEPQAPMPEGQMPEGGAPQGGAEQVVKDAMAQCGLDANDPAEARAFAAGVKFGEGEINKTQQPQQPLANPQQPQQPQNPMAKDTNALVRKVEARLNAKFKAIKECEKTLGKVEPTAYDCAGSVYLDALKQEGIRTKGMDAKAARAAYRAFFAGKTREQKLAQDSAPVVESALAKVLQKIKVGA